MVGVKVALFGLTVSILLAGLLLLAILWPWVGIPICLAVLAGLILFARMVLWEIDD